MSESYQEKLKRVRPPRVRIDYTVETEGAEPILELPFVVGILADLGSDKSVKQPLKQRPFANIDRDNFNQVMAKAKPRVAFTVPNKLTGAPGETLPVALEFNHLSDFEPGKIAEKVPALNELLQMRRQLENLLGKMEGNDELVKQLEDIIKASEAKAAGG